MSALPFLIIGAGPLGLAMAKALREEGVPYVQAEATDHVGGNWAHGVYETAHIISSRKTTEYPDFPMPDDWPDFPSAQQMNEYFERYTDAFDLRPRIRFGSPVSEVQRAGDAWQARLGDGPPERFAGVFVCNGHHWSRRLPPWAGDFTGELLHSKDYKRPAMLAGKRVLVIGGGNSGCDLVSEAARVGARCDWSLRRGYWFMPKSFLGRPTVEWLHPWAPLALQRLVCRGIVRLSIGRYEDFGLPTPDHRLFEAHPTVNSEVFHYLAHGKVRPRRDVASIDGQQVTFGDGEVETYDTIVCCTGYDVRFPFLPEGLVPVKGKTPQVLGGALVPGQPGLYIVGGFQVRYGIGPVVRPYAQMLARWARLQGELPIPMADVLAALGERPPPDHLVGPHESIRRAKLAMRLEPLIRFTARRLAARRGAEKALPAGAAGAR